jgi:hypothetical protein
MKSTLIRPGLLVSLKTNVRGGVTYQKHDLEPDATTEEGVAHAKWETTRRIANVEEFKAAATVRNKCRSLIVTACCPSSFGLLCPIAKETQLREAIDAAQVIADEHNAKATHTRVEFYVITGRVADNDEQAARALGSEVRDLLGAMERGVRAADPKAIREAANKARLMAGVLSVEVQGKVAAAIAEVRAVARDIVQRVGVSGERAADVVDKLKLDALTNARFAVLDITGDDGGGFVESTVVGRAIDLGGDDNDDAGDGAISVGVAPSIEME